MSAKRQHMDRVKGRSFPCSKVKHFTRSEARAHLEDLKNKGLRGTARLRVYKCTPCAKKEKRDVFHVGHNNGKRTR